MKISFKIKNIYCVYMLCGMWRKWKYALQNARALSLSLSIQLNIRRGKATGRCDRCMYYAIGITKRQRHIGCYAL